MELREWVRQRFGATDETLLNENVYGSRELRKDKAKLEQKLKKLEQEMDEHSRRYKKLLREGADADEMRRQTLAQKAKFEKKKYETTKKKHKANSIKLGTIISIQGMRDVMSMQGEDELNIDGVMEDIDTQKLQSKIMEEMAAAGLELEDMQEIQRALDMPILEDEVEVGASEELALMEEMAAGKVSEEQIDVASSVEVTSEERTVEELDIDEELEDSAI